MLFLNPLIQLVTGWFKSGDKVITTTEGVAADMAAETTKGFTLSPLKNVTGIANKVSEAVSYYSPTAIVERATDAVTASITAAPSNALGWLQGIGGQAWAWMQTNLPAYWQTFLQWAMPLIQSANIWLWVAGAAITAWIGHKLYRKRRGAANYTAIHTGEDAPQLAESMKRAMIKCHVKGKTLYVTNYHLGVARRFMGQMSYV